MKIPRAVLTFVLLACFGAAAANAWLSRGHHMVAEAAVGLLPDEVPAFFRAGAAAVAHAAIDPDVMKDRSQPQLQRQESPEHYLDLELLGGRQLPEDRYLYLELLAWLAAEPRPQGYAVRDVSTVGFLPYAVVEGTQRLTLVFAEHRRWPDDPHIRAKALFYAGLLSHYAADLCQPLHTTVHHDGRANPDGTTPLTGFHRRVDGLFERVAFDRQRALAGVRPRVLDSLFAGVLTEFGRSHERVDELYALEPLIDPEAPGWPASPVVELAAERFANTAGFLASLYLAAWERSAGVELPGWLERRR